MRPRRRDRRFKNAGEAAGNGLLDRRVFLKGGVGAVRLQRGERGRAAGNSNGNDGSRRSIEPVRVTGHVRA